MKRHQKSYEAPTERWGIPTKERAWTAKAIPGPHSKDKGVPLLVLIRDILGYAERGREAERAIGERKVKVDGKVVTQPNLPVGLMDVLSISGVDESYRVLFDQHGSVHLGPIEEGDENWKLCRIDDKKEIKGGTIQYNLHDGRNINLDEPNAHKTKDVLKIDLPSQNIMDSYPFQEDMLALVIGGKHIGELGKIQEYEVVKGSQSNMVHFEEGMSTVEENVFVVGKEKPEIKIPEVGII